MQLPESVILAIAASPPSAHKTVLLGALGVNDKLERIDPETQRRNLESLAAIADPPAAEELPF